MYIHIYTCVYIHWKNLIPLMGISPFMRPLANSQRLQHCGLWSYNEAPLEGSLEPAGSGRNQARPKMEGKPEPSLGYS